MKMIPNSLSDTKTRSIRNKEIPSMIEDLLKRMNLSYWRIDRSPVGPNSPGHLMEIAINRKRRIATLKISNQALALPIEKFVQCLKHELIHLLLDELVEELQEAKTYTNRVDIRVERLVENLSLII